jgi:DNA protecting protein DprA
MKINRINEEQYPYLLKQINRKPEYLDIAGTFPGDTYKFLCVVGSRTYSSYGEKVVRSLIHGLKGHPVVIVSGLAIGIDSLAHEAALEAGLKTVAFPGSGLLPEVLYPSSRRKLAEKIISSGGALVSPFLPEQVGDYWTFPTRNRLMAAVSHATLVIEGRQGSGTLGTADFATEFSRDVLAVPGEIFSELSYGPHMLIQKGAGMITCSEDILEALGITVQRKKIVKPKNKHAVDRMLYIRNMMNGATAGKPGKNKNIETDTPLSTPELIFPPPLAFNLDALALSPAERTICDQLVIEKLSATDLIYKTSLPSSTFNITISELEMKNLVHEDGGIYRMKYR